MPVGYSRFVRGRRPLPVQGAGIAASGIVGFYANGMDTTALKSKMTATRTGTGQTLIARGGDSTTIGQGGGTGTNGCVGAFANNPNSKLADLYAASGIVAREQSRFGDGRITAASVTLQQYDPRSDVPTTTWTLTNGGVGQMHRRATGGGVEPWRLTPTVARDTDVLIYCSISGGATLNVTVGGSPPLTNATIATASASAVPVRVAITSEKSVGTLALTPAASAGELNVIGSYSYDSTVGSINFVTLGQCGQRSDILSTNSGFRAIPTISTLAPDLYIVDIGYNDRNGGIGDASHITMLNSVKAVTVSAGRALLVVIQSPAGPNYSAGMDVWNTDVKAWCATNNVACLSMWENLGSAFTPAIQAKMFDGIVHRLASYNTEIATIEKQVIDLLVA